MSSLFSDFSQKIISYLPNLFAGIVLIGVGWLLSWFVKRVVYQLCVILRLERYLQRFSRGTTNRADVRHGLYNFIGSIAFLIVFLIFLNDALSTMKLEIFSDLLEDALRFLPKLIIGAVIFGVGWFLARRVALAVQKVLTRENIPRSTLIAKFVKAALIIFFSAMALTALDIAKQIVIIAFTTTFVTLGVLTIVLTMLSGKEMISKLLDALGEKR
ncbi:MAG: hypothetical protein ABH878_01755 [bacterium]